MGNSDNYFINIVCKNILGDQHVYKDDDQETKKIFLKIVEISKIVEDAIDYLKKHDRGVVYNKFIDDVWENKYCQYLINKPIKNEDYVVNNFSYYVLFFDLWFKDILSVLISYNTAKEENVSKFKKHISFLEKLLYKSNINEKQKEDLKNRVEFFYSEIHPSILNLRIEEKFYVMKREFEENSFFVDGEKKLIALKEEGEKLWLKVKDEIQRASLIKTFESFVSYTRSKLATAKKIRWISFSSMFVVPILNIIGHFCYGLGLEYVIAGCLLSFLICVLMGIVFKVALRSEDQLEQVLHKLNNKTAIIYYYHNDKENLKKEGVPMNKEIDAKFYDFLFSDIETKEWNSPDVGQSIIDIIKAVKSS